MLLCSTGMMMEYGEIPVRAELEVLSTSVTQRHLPYIDIRPAGESGCATPSLSGYTHERPQSLSSTRSTMTTSVTVRSSLLVLSLAALLALFYKPLVIWVNSSAGDASVSFKSTPLKLYGASMSTCTRRVATILKEKDVPYELVPVDMANRGHKSPEYMTNMQPFGQVPVLQVMSFLSRT